MSELGEYDDSYILNLIFDLERQCGELHKVVESLEELVTFIQDAREADTLGNRIFKLEEAVFGDGK